MPTKSSRPPVSPVVIVFRGEENSHGEIYLRGKHVGDCHLTPGDPERTRLHLCGGGFDLSGLIEIGHTPQRIIEEQ